MSKNNGKVVKISGKVDAQAIVGSKGYPEVGMFADEKSLQKFYKQLSQEQLDEWCVLEGLTYKDCENEPIKRMRACMAIMDKHFPKQTGSSKKESPY
jgi:hypothetical protein